MCRKKASFLSEPSPFVCKSPPFTSMLSLYQRQTLKFETNANVYVWTDLKILLFIKGVFSSQVFDQKLTI